MELNVLFLSVASAATSVAVFFLNGEVEGVLIQINERGPLPA